MREHAEPLDSSEATELLSLALVGAGNSAFRLWCRCVDLASVDRGPSDRPDPGRAEELVDLCEEAEVAMQVIDRAYRRLSMAYFDAVGADGVNG